MIGKTCLLVATCLLASGCAVSTGYRSGGAAEAVSGTAPVYVSITGVELVDRGRARDAFWQHLREVNAQLPEQNGLIGYSLRRELLGNAAWTMSIWEDRQAMRAFVRSPRHAAAMKEGTAGIADMAFVTFEMEANALPLRWEDALTRLEKDGRPYAY